MEREMEMEMQMEMEREESVVRGGDVDREVQMRCVSRCGLEVL